MKKGLRNTVAMGALALMNMFGGIKQANAGWIDSEEKAQEAAEQVFQDTKFKSTWTEEDIEKMRANTAVEVVKAKEMLPTLLKLISKKNGIDFSKIKEVTLTSSSDDGWFIDYPNNEKGCCIDGDGKLFWSERDIYSDAVQYVVNPQKGTFRWNAKSEKGRFTLSSSKEIEMGKGKDFETLSEERLQEILDDNRILVDGKNKKATDLLDFIQEFGRRNKLSLDSGEVIFLTREDGRITSFLVQETEGEAKGFELSHGLGIMKDYTLELKHSELIDGNGNGRDYSGAITVNMDKGTYQLAGSAAVQFGHGGIASPELSFAPVKELTLDTVKKDIQGLLKAPLKMGKDLTPMTAEGEAIGPDGPTTIMKGLGDHLTNWGKSNHAQRSKNLKQFLVKGADGKMKVDLSRCKSVLAAYNMDGDLTYLALNYQNEDTTPKDGVLLRYNSNDGTVSLTDEDDGTALLECSDKWVVINPAKNSFKLKGDHNDYSPEMSYTSEKAKTVAPAVKKAISERLQKN